jgi:hypothetical protein
MRIIVPPAGTHCGQARGVSSPDIGAGASGPLALLIVVLAMAGQGQWDCLAHKTPEAITGRARDRRSIGNRRMAITASVSRADGSTFPTTPWSPSRTAPAERWCGRCGLTAKPLSGASCPAAWPRARGAQVRPHTAGADLKPAALTRRVFLLALAGSESCCC